MKAAPFAYHRPGAVNEAVDLLAEYGDDAKILGKVVSVLRKV